MTTNNPIHIGWEEWISLPELNLPAIKAKVDTGAKTSALHAFTVKKIKEQGEVKVRFGIHPIPEHPEIEVYCTALLVDEREVISSNGQVELRYVIRTMAKFGKEKWPIEISLTDRETMAYRMLLGRAAMEDKLVVVPGGSFLLGKHPAAYKTNVVKARKRKMHFCILSGSQNHYSTKRLITQAEHQGHQVSVIDPTRCYVDISANHPTVHYQETPLPHFDVIIPRVSSSITFYGVAILRQFESLGIFTLNSATAISHSRDRLLAHQLLNRSGVEMPPTAFAHNPKDIKGMIALLGGAPLTIKLLESPNSKRMMVLAQTNKAAEAVIRTMRGLNANFIAQQYIKERTSKDIWCIVLGRKVIAAMQKSPKEESNHLDDKSRHMSVITLTLQEKKLAVKAVRVLGLKFAGVNLLRTKAGPKILDVNSSPALRNIERVSDINIAKHLIDYLENHARPRLPKRLIGYQV